MHSSLRQDRRLALGLLCLLVLAGCQSAVVNTAANLPGDYPVPVAAELNYVNLPPYRIEPPDILLIDALRIVPKEPFRIEPLDLLSVKVEGTLNDQPIEGQYSVEPSGAIDLGPAYGKVQVAGLTLDEAIAETEKHLQRILRSPEVAITLAASGGQAQIAGQRLVGPDGMVNLGTYGMVYVAGLTIKEATDAIKLHLSQFLSDPVISVDIASYNSKVFYVYAEGAGVGDNIQRFPITGKETVLDAIAAVGGLSQVASKNIWIARPAPGGEECEQILPVKWDDIVRGGRAATNYQIMPGDRVFIQHDHMIAADNAIAKFTAPFERIMGFSLLGANTVATAQRYPGGLQGQGFNNFQ